MYGLTGSQAVLAWHASHERVVTKWLVGLPIALVPLWQEAQVPATTPVWLKVAGSQAVVRWQVSQDAVVTIWLAVLPLALVPLWQEAQVPGATLA